MVKIKICGLTTPADYNLVVECQTDFTGFIFYQESSRYINPQKVKDIITKGARGNHQKVGIFVNETPKIVQEVYRYVGLDIVQLHGDESPAYCRSLNLPLWKVIRVEDRHFLEKMQDFDCPAYLLDTFVKNLYGGSGKVMDLNYARQAVKTGKNIIIAGGMGEDNIVQVFKLKPYAFDVNS